jgi:integrase
MKLSKNHPGYFEDLKGDYRRLVLYVHGQRHLFRCPSKDRRECEKFAREKHRDLLRQVDRARGRGFHKTSFAALLDQYRRDDLPTRSLGTQRAYEDSLKMFREYFVDELGDPSIEDISTKHVRGFLAWRRNQRRAGKHRKPTSEPVSNRTLEKDRAVLHRIFAFAEQLELREGNPVSKVERPKGDQRNPVLLSDEQYDALLKACAGHPQLQLYALTLGETGGRCQSEILHLKWDDVDLDGGWIEIRSGDDGHRTKSGKSRNVPMTKRLIDAMELHRQRTRATIYHGKRTPWVFHHERDRRGCEAGGRVKSMRSAFDTAAAAAGLPAGFHRHDLRHRRATTMIAAGVSPVLVKEILGHSDLRTTMGYTHMSKQHLRAAVDILEKAAAAAPALRKA